MQGKDHHKVHSCPIYTCNIVQFFGEKDMVLLVLVVPEICEKKGIIVNVKHHYSLLFYKPTRWREGCHLHHSAGEGGYIHLMGLGGLARI